MKSASGVVIALILVAIFGRLIPIALLALVIILPVIIIKNAIKEGKFL